jgi:hypothetical protein
MWGTLSPAVRAAPPLAGLRRDAGQRGD